MKLINLGYPCSCGAKISFISRLGFEERKEFVIPCRVCNAKRNVVIMNYTITMSNEYEKPGLLDKILRFLRIRKNY